MITVLMKISFQYWKRHKRRLYTMATAVIMGVAALCCIALLIRSEKTVLLNQMLDYWGEYDLIVYETQMETAEDIFNTNGVTASGFYYELGYAARPDGGNEYKVAAYADIKSEEIHHASCIRGTYPENAQEVALDIETAKSLGISPYPGEQIELALYDLENQVLSNRIFKVSGIFVMSNKDSYGGYYRYPGENYAVPTVFVSADMNQMFQTETVTAFVQVENVGVRDAVKAFSTSEDRKWLVDNMSFDRTIAYSSVLGNFHYMYLDYGNLDIDSVEQSLDDQNYSMDFYSNILMPLLSFLVLLIVLISLIELIRNVLKDRAEMLAVLRSIGLSAKGSGIYLTIEFCVLTILLSLVGLLVGMGCHVGMITLLNRFFSTRMSAGFQVSKYVAAVTYDPYSLPLFIIGISVLGAVLFSVVKFIKIAPVMIFQGQLEHKHRKRRQKARSRHSAPKGWLPLLNERRSGSVYGGCRIQF